MKTKRWIAYDCANRIWATGYTADEALSGARDRFKGDVSICQSTETVCEAAEEGWGLFTQWQRIKFRDTRSKNPKAKRFVAVSVVGIG